MDIPQWIQAGGAIASAFVGWSAWRTAVAANRRADDVERRASEQAERLNWLLGAIETHSTFHLRLAAKINGIKVTWWDPTIEPVPFRFMHGDEDRLDEVRLSLPPEYRKNPTSVPRHMGKR